MKRDKLLNPELLKAVAALGHTEYLVIGDAGLPMQGDVPVIDISLTRGIPAFMDVVEAVASELVTESFIYASEADTANPQLVTRLKECLGCPAQSVSHTEFKALTKKAKAFVRTGETSAFANVILVGGVNF